MAQEAEVPRFGISVRCPQSNGATDLKPTGRPPQIACHPDYVSSWAGFASQCTCISIFSFFPCELRGREGLALPAAWPWQVTVVRNGIGATKSEPQGAQQSSACHSGQGPERPELTGSARIVRPMAHSHGGHPDASECRCPGFLQLYLSTEFCVHHPQIMAGALMVLVSRGRKFLSSTTCCS